jgi:hypothetical protein
MIPFVGPHDPPTLEDYHHRSQERSRVIGFGVETAVVLPCPFCAAPEWLTHRIVDTLSSALRPPGVVCQVCGRGMAAIFSTLADGGTCMELVHTVGDPAPHYLPPIRGRE